jgi:phosphatidylinositol alpha-mannosyltransferase
LAIRLRARRVHVIPHLVNPALVTALGEMGARSGTADEPTCQTTLLYYGRWAPIKGLDVLAAAIRELPGTYQRRLSLRIFGNGDRAWLRECFGGIELGGLTIGGWLSDDQKPSELRGADAMVLPSRAEAFGASLVEAMAAGTPIIASSVGAIPEVLNGYGAARLVRAGDAGQLRGAVRALIERTWPPASTSRSDWSARYEPNRIVGSLLGAYEAARQDGRGSPAPKRAKVASLSEARRRGLIGSRRRLRLRLATWVGGRE